MCIGVYDIGTQPSTKFSPSRQITLTWEMCDEFMEDGKPFAISNDFAFYLSGKAKLRNAVESLMNRNFASDLEASKFDVTRVLGRGCQVQVVHNPAKNGSGKVYANVEITMKLPKGTPVPTPINELREFSYTEGDIPSWMPKWTADKIRKCLEWAEVQAPEAVSSAPAALASRQAPAFGKGIPSEDDVDPMDDMSIPF